jgi:hypothetical protein
MDALLGGVEHDHTIAAYRFTLMAIREVGEFKGDTLPNASHAVRWPWDAPERRCCYFFATAQDRQCN